MALIGLPLIVGSIVGGLAHAVGSLVGRVLVSLGVSFVTYYGMDTMVDWVRDQALGKLQGLPTELYTVLDLLQVPAVINVYFAAWMAALALTGLQAGTFVKQVQRLPGSGS